MLTSTEKNISLGEGLLRSHTFSQQLCPPEAEEDLLLRQQVQHRLQAQIQCAWPASVSCPVDECVYAW